jgi:hypothetical protein
MIVDIKSLRRVHEKIGLRGTRPEKATFETTIGRFIQEIWAVSNCGCRQMVTTLLQDDYSLKVPRVRVNKVSIHWKQARDLSRRRIADYFRLTESDGVKLISDCIGDSSRSANGQ